MLLPFFFKLASILIDTLAQSQEFCGFGLYTWFYWIGAIDGFKLGEEQPNSATKLSSDRLFHIKHKNKI